MMRRKSLAIGILGALMVAAPVMARPGGGGHGGGGGGGTCGGGGRARAAARCSDARGPLCGRWGALCSGGSRLPGWRGGGATMLRRRSTRGPVRRPRGGLRPCRWVAWFSGPAAYGGYSAATAGIGGAWVIAAREMATGTAATAAGAMAASSERMGRRLVARWLVAGRVLRGGFCLVPADSAARVFHLLVQRGTLCYANNA